MDFFTVPTISFGVLYCFFVIRHDRRRILHFNITKHPTSGWIIQQLREAFPFGASPRFLIHDRDAKYGTEVPAAIRSLNINAVRTSFESPWQNGVAERWVGSCRRELLDHVIALNERHLKRLLSEYVSYHHEDRTHLGLRKETPSRRIRSAATGPVICHARLGGLHPSLRPRGLRPADFHWLTRLGTSVGSSVTNKEQSAPTQHLRPRTQPISCRDTLFMTIFEVHFELWRATGPLVKRADRHGANRYRLERQGISTRGPGEIQQRM